MGLNSAFKGLTYFYIKADGLFDNYTVSWGNDMEAPDTNVRATWKGTLSKKSVSCILGSSEAVYDPSDGYYD